MEIFSDVVLLSRFQFALCIIFHFIFVPMSIGIGLIVAIMQTKAYRSGEKRDYAIARFWVKIFAVTFAVGVATGITMEFSFGTNWANYSRFVGDVFGAPLAAEALLAFFLESSFLGVLIFGRNKVSPRFYMAAGWLVWIGSLLSALWILIANSWMQTPAGYEVVVTAAGTKAMITDFWAAAFNPSTGPRYFHTVVSLLIYGAFVAIAIGAWHMLRGDKEFGKKTMKVSSVICIVTLALMLPAAHEQAVEVAENQPTKFAAMEGQWETGPSDMALVGWVDEANRTTYSIDLPLRGATSFLASNSFDTVYPGLNEFPDEYLPPINVTFQGYHIMVALFGLMLLFWIFAIVAARKKEGQTPRWMLWLLVFSPILPFVAIQAGWLVTEVGRQPWIVWGELLTADAISPSVSATDLCITIGIFFVFYAFILIAYLRIIFRFIKEGPDYQNVQIPHRSKMVAATASDATDAAPVAGLAEAGREAGEADATVETKAAALDATIPDDAGSKE